VVIAPVYQDTLPSIDGFNSRQWVVMIPKMTIPVTKRMQLLINEKNGGRILTLEIHNKDLLRAKPL
jgi:hypothetical protein